MGRKEREGEQGGGRKGEQGEGRKGKEGEGRGRKESEGEGGGGRGGRKGEEGGGRERGKGRKGEEWGRGREEGEAAHHTAACHVTVVTSSSRLVTYPPSSPQQQPHTHTHTDLASDAQKYSTPVALESSMVKCVTDSPLTLSSSDKGVL